MLIVSRMLNEGQFTLFVKEESFWYQVVSWSLGLDIMSGAISSVTGWYDRVVA